METSSIYSLLKYAPTPIAIVDTNLNFLNYSDQWIKLFVEEGQDIIGSSFFNVIKDYPSSIKEALKKSLLGHEHSNEGQKFELLSGELKWLKWKVIPFEESKGNIEGTIIFLEDVTHIKRELELSSKVGKTAKIGGWEVDLISNTIYWNETTKKIHEVSHDYVPNLETGINFYKKGPDRDKITELISLAIEKGIGWDVELIIITANGNEKWVRAKGETELLNGKCVRLFGTFQDIDEKKKAELKYNVISERLKIATNAANIGIWEYDLIEGSLVWDKNMYQLYGQKEEDFSGAYDAWQSALHPDDLQDGERAVELAISNKKEFDIEFRVVLPKTGEIRNIKALATTERNEEGTAIKMIGCNWDITELKKTKLQLQKTEESFLETFENSAAGMALVALDGSLTKVNKSFCDSLGYTEKELLELTFQEFTHPEDLETDLKLLQQVVDNKRESYQLEKRYIHKKGSIVYVILTVTAQKNIEGEIVNFVGHIIDISARINAELKVKETIKSLNVATNVANIGIWNYEIDTNTISANNNMYTIYGIESDASNLLEEWINRIHIEDRDRIRQEFSDTIQNGTPFVTQFKAVKKGGETIYVAAFGETQKDAKGNIIGVIGSNLDITALRHSELKLERSNESFSEIFKNSAIGMAIVDKDNYWLKVNETLCNSLGYTEEELQKITVTDLTHPDDLEKSLKQLNSGKNSYQLEKRYFHKEGHIVHVILAVTLVKDLDNKVSHSIAQILDLTERLEAAKRLNTLVNVTKAQNESLMNFAHIVSHNLRSHSSNMNMLTSFMAKEKDPEEIIKLNEMISDASSNLSDTVADLNDVVQIQSGALDQLKSISLLNAFNKAKNSIAALIEKEEAAFLVSISKSHFVNAVPSYLESILLNLITNSLKYKSPDRNPVLQITSAIKEDMVHITFTDNGQGIDLDRHGDKIFGMYKTFHKHKDAKGIGLFITKNQIESMRGKIYLESEVGKYTTVHIELKQG